MIDSTFQSEDAAKWIEANWQMWEPNIRSIQ